MVAPLLIIWGRFSGGYENAKVRGRELNTNFFVYNLSGFPGYPGKHPGISRQKVWFPWASKDKPNLFGPHPFMQKTPTLPEDIRTKKFGFGFLSLA